MRKKSTVHKKIMEMADRIVVRFNPEKIILFGSHARDEGGQDSDVDLLIDDAGEGLKKKDQAEYSTGASRYPYTERYHCQHARRI
jgi:predicted nucleotidyltransferase